jgi:hypothetical protein
MPYYVGEDMPEWDQYTEWEGRGPGRGETPAALFKYIDPSQAKTTVLPFPATPGPEPEPPQDDGYQEDMEAVSAYALWEVSRQTATCRELGVKRVFGRYDGGGDESFTYYQGVEMSDGHVIPASSVLRTMADPVRGEPRCIDYDGLVENAVSALMGHYGEGPFSLQGVVIIDFDACTVTDEKNIDIVLGDKMPWEI